jgi:hypothetical protein
MKRDDEITGLSKIKQQIPRKLKLAAESKAYPNKIRTTERHRLCCFFIG